MRVSLSTAKPKIGSEAPLPAAIWVTGSQAGDQKTLVQQQENRKQTLAEGVPTQTGPEHLELEDKGQSVLLTIPNRVSIRADGRPYWISVDVIKTKGDAKLVTIPKKSPYVYQTISLKNTAVYPLLP